MACGLRVSLVSVLLVRQRPERLSRVEKSHYTGAQAPLSLQGLPQAPHPFYNENSGYPWHLLLWDRGAIPQRWLLKRDGLLLYITSWSRDAISRDSVSLSVKAHWVAWWLHKLMYANILLIWVLFLRCECMCFLMKAYAHIHDLNVALCV